MKIQIRSLTLNCKAGVERIQFGRQLSFFHGEMSSGKSSMASLVDYCLGGSLEKTPALRSELLSVQMEATLGDTRALIERVLTDPGNVQVSWFPPAGPPASDFFPVKAGPNPIIGDSVYGLSDLLLSLLGLPVLRARKRSYDPDSDLVRLSFRDLMEFVYLNQDDLDSDFFLLDIPIRMEKSKDALHFFVGFMSERLNELQTGLQELRVKQRSMREAAARIEDFLRKFDFESVGRLDEEITKVEAELEGYEEQLGSLTAGFTPEMSLADEDRAAMAEVTERISELTRSNSEVQGRIREQDALVSELVSWKFKLTRAASATALLEGVKFEACPACGTNVSGGSTRSSDQCYLCKNVLVPGDASITAAEVERQDVDDRIEDLKQSLQRHRRALQRNESRLIDLRRRRSALDAEITSRSRRYESEFLARSRSYERKIAAARERISFLERVKEMPTSLDQVMREADGLSADIDERRRLISNETERLIGSEENFKAIELNYKQILLSLGFPGVTPEDVVVINRRSLIAEIWTRGEESKKWSFFDAGSGGKKTLLKISFALALHKAAAERDLPIPRLLIIDSPMKNITPDVNRAIFEKFYAELYSLLAGPLGEWQCIVIDQTYLPPPEGTLDAMNRMMKLHDLDHPPLIRYYDGP